MSLTQFNDIFFCCCLGLKTVCRQTKSQSRKGDNWKGDKRKVRGITLPRKKKTFKKLMGVLEPKIRILSLVFVESKHLKGQQDPPVCNVTLLDHQVVLNGSKKLVIFVFSRLVYRIQVKPWIFPFSFYLHTFLVDTCVKSAIILIFFRKYCFQNQGLQVQEVWTPASHFVNFASGISY